jgi:phage FluMu protein Com
MIRCGRCGSGFSSLHVATEVSCPRCRARDGVTASFVSANAGSQRPVFSDPLTEMTRRVERGRAKLHG